MSKKQTSGADALIQSLHEEGVELVFGYPGGAALHIYDALFTQSEVEHILVRHFKPEQHFEIGRASCRERV